ncbi:unnamed protein product [Onchocerca flexuosa]|uniref:Uncharacterized protein n=1 Tax=Onchocerca flexuosa TaxID=387005 RepID=A0A183HEC3_9BILA|nr:unnamed protein product [Onchocerca flexuosa]
MSNRVTIIDKNITRQLEYEIFSYGKLAACGPYKELLEKSENFLKFIEACQTESEKEENSKSESESSGSIVIDDDNSQLHGCEEAYDIEEVNEGSFVRFGRRISTLSTLDRRSSRSYHRSSQVKSFPEYSNDQLSNEDKEKKAKLIEIEKIEVGRTGRGLWLSKWL